MLSKLSSLFVLRSQAPNQHVTMEKEEERLSNLIQETDINGQRQCYLMKELDNSKIVGDSETGNWVMVTVENDEPRKRKEDTVENEANTVRKQQQRRIRWTPELHAKFVEAVNQLGFYYSTPKLILEFMDVSGVTRENIATHLQRYRNAQKKSATLNIGLMHQSKHCVGIQRY